MNLQEVLKLHDMWLNKEKDGQKASLNQADLRKADLSEADLREADLRRANLSGAKLSGADLHEADLHEAELRKADLSGANLRKADLRGANFSGANLSGADLREANIENIITDENTAFFQIACPDEGEFIAWKKARIIHHDHHFEYVIIKLLIPANALHSSATTYKCRADRAIPLEIQTIEGEKLDAKKAISNYDQVFEYVIGQECYIPDFCTNRWIECAAGIHFFINRAKAVMF